MELCYVCLSAPLLGAVVLQLCKLRDPSDTLLYFISIHLYYTRYPREREHKYTFVPGGRYDHEYEPKQVHVYIPINSGYVVSGRYDLFIQAVFQHQKLTAGDVHSTTPALGGVTSATATYGIDRDNARQHHRKTKAGEREKVLLCSACLLLLLLLLLTPTSCYECGYS